MTRHTRESLANEYKTILITILSLVQGFALQEMIKSTVDFFWKSRPLESGLLIYLAECIPFLCLLCLFLRITQTYIAAALDANYYNINAFSVFIIFVVGYLQYWMIAALPKIGVAGNLHVFYGIGSFLLVVYGLLFVWGARKVKPPTSHQDVIIFRSHEAYLHEIRLQMRNSASMLISGALLFASMLLVANGSVGESFWTAGLATVVITANLADSIRSKFGLISNETIEEFDASVVASEFTTSPQSGECTVEELASYLVSSLQSRVFSVSGLSESLAHSVVQDILYHSRTFGKECWSVSVLEGAIRGAVLLVKNRPKVLERQRNNVVLRRYFGRRVLEALYQDLDVLERACARLKPGQALLVIPTQRSANNLYVQDAIQQAIGSFPVGSKVEIFALVACDNDSAKDILHCLKFMHIFTDSNVFPELGQDSKVKLVNDILAHVYRLDIVVR